ncbi:GxxExxY protein [candidate division KSB1 bacterium]|nr:GxxExxY protein [candidate division KSB1 bacterium]
MKLVYEEMTHVIIGAAMRVHSFLGNGFQEVIYQRALALELINTDFEFSREVEMPIYYRNFEKPIGTRRVDFIVEETVLVELKAVSALETVHHAQVLNYLKVYRLPVGLLINFGESSLSFKRFIRRNT